jgi:4-hydroxy-tetrahydrodipicolinate reductase
VNLMLVGYGKMGKMIETVAKEKGHQVVSIVDPLAPGAGHAAIGPEAVKGADLAIEFTAPSSAFANIESLLSLGLPVVVGTTGWLGRLEEARALVEAKKGLLVYGANYSIGVNLFCKIVAEAARLLDGFPQYDAAGFELHHAQKADSPSGTAKAIAKILLDRLERKTSIQSETLAERRPRPEELHFASLRVGSVPGTHTVLFDSAFDTIELTHTARTREGFARGAVMAAEWIMASGRKGLVPVEEMYAGL